MKKVLIFLIVSISLILTSCSKSDNNTQGSSSSTIAVTTTTTAAPLTDVEQKAKEGLAKLESQLNDPKSLDILSIKGYEPTSKTDIVVNIEFTAKNTKGGTERNNLYFYGDNFVTRGNPNSDVYTYAELAPSTMAGSMWGIYAEDATDIDINRIK